MLNHFMKRFLQGSAASAIVTAAAFAYTSTTQPQIPEQELFQGKGFVVSNPHRAFCLKYTYFHHEREDSVTRCHPKGSYLVSYKGLAVPLLQQDAHQLYKLENGIATAREAGKLVAPIPFHAMPYPTGVNIGTTILWDSTKTYRDDTDDGLIKTGAGHTSYWAFHHNGYVSMLHSHKELQEKADPNSDRPFGSIGFYIFLTPYWRG